MFFFPLPRYYSSGAAPGASSASVSAASFGSFVSSSSVQGNYLPSQNNPATSSSFDPFGSNSPVPSFTTSTSNINHTNIHNFPTQSTQPHYNNQQVMPPSSFPSFDPFSSTPSMSTGITNNMGGNNNVGGGNNNVQRTTDVLSLFDQAPPVVSAATTTTTGLNGSNRAASIR